MSFISVLWWLPLILGLTNAQNETPVSPFHIQHVQSKLFIGENADIVTEKLAKWGFHYKVGETDGRIISYDTGNVAKALKVILAKFYIGNVATSEIGSHHVVDEVTSLIDKALDVRGGCDGTEIITYKDKQSTNQKFYFSPDGTIRSKCDTNQVVAPDKTGRKLILEKYDPLKLTRYIFAELPPEISVSN